MDNLAKLLKQYDYSLPPQLIAQKPAKPRDSARLLVYNRAVDKSQVDTFKNLGKYLPKNAILVFNQTKVWPARLKVKKTSGGKAELLYLGHNNQEIRALSNKPLTPGQFVTVLCGRTKLLQMEVIKKEKQIYIFRPYFKISLLPKILQRYGRTPLPPYIKNSPLTEKQKREEYQSVFAKNGLSVAAPTASLHFTKKLIDNLKKQGIAVKFARLDVGLGTFATLKDENLKSGKLHKEFYSIDKDTANFLNQAKKQGRPIIAVGTTVARTLESATKNHQLINHTGNTDLFINQGYKFQFIDGLITNFHVPKSSLLMLVSAFAGRKKILDLYQTAIKKKFRFFSFGDGMIIT